MNVGIEKVDTHEGRTVKALLDSGATGLFMSKGLVQKGGYRLIKLDRPLQVRNVDGTGNSGGAIMHEVEVNMFYKGYVERVRMDVCELGKTDIILGMPWLAAHNLEIDWEKGEVRMTRCPPLCGKAVKIKGKKETREDERKIVRWAVDEKEDWGREEEIEADHRKVEKMVPKRFHKWLKVFRKVESERMPVRKVWDHAIDLNNDFKASKAKVYPLSRNEKEEVQKFINEHLKKGYIRPSKSPQTSPVFFVGKKDGGKCMVMDYRRLNKQTVKNNYPLPLITDLVYSMGNKRVFTKMDLRWGYNNVRIKEGNEWKAVFTTHVGSYEPLVMFFGMTNSPATFQGMMNEILRDMVNEGKVAVFVDDVLVGTETEEGHEEIVEEVLKRLEENDLYVKPEKCAWKVQKVNFLGVVMDEGKIEMEEDKVAGVLNWPIPKTVRDVRKFLGLANYYRHFVKDFAKLARPLNNLTRKKEKWKWGEEQQKAFEQLKMVFMSRPLLVAPDLDKEFRVEADTSNFATGGVLSIKCEDNKWRPVAYISKSLNETEQNYEIHDKEMLAVIHCLEAWRHFLEGTRSKFEVWTDHKNLEYFMSNQKLNRRQACWALYLSRFDFVLKHISGGKMGKADRLSRRPDWEVGIEKDNKEQMLVKKEWLEAKRIRVTEVIIEGVDLLDKVRKSKARDDEVVKAVEEMKQAGVKMLRDEEWRQEDGLMLKEGKVYIPKDEKLRAEVIRLHHDTPVEGHGGQWKTAELVTRNFWWPGVTREVKRYVEGCDACQRNKNRTQPPAGKLMPNSIPEKAWTHISADFITKLPLAQGYYTILVVVDRFTKMAHFVPTTERTSAEGLARLFRDNIWKLHGLPDSIISDRGPQFAAGIIKELNRMLGIETKLSIAFHPQTDGQMERMNQELEQYLPMFIDHRQEQWPEWLGMAEFAYNNKVHTGTKVSPFKANQGQDLRMGFEMRKKRKYEGAEKFAEKMRSVQEEAKAVLQKVQEEMKRYVDRERGEVEEYQVGDLVLLSTKDLKYQMVGRHTEKFTERFVGPYRVKAIVSSNAIELELPSTVKIHPVVNVSRVRKYKSQVEGQRKEAPQPVVIKGEEE